MTEKVYYISSGSDNVYKNLALEEYLLSSVKSGTVILYLWQNRKTVVIGKNQSAFKECRVAKLEQDDGRLARRLSGGGAVFHDLGNLNFTFLANDGDYNLDRQLEVILRAVTSFGLDARRSGRNDLTVCGRKFSGNAFYKNRGKRYHHGTLLVDVDMNMMSEYLNVSIDKLSSKGIDSVRSRVVNLSALCGEINVETLRQRLITSFAEVYGINAEILPDDLIAQNQLAALERKYASDQFKFGEPFESTFKAGKRFLWGDISFEISICGGRMDKCAVFSDCMNAEFIERLRDGLVGQPFSVASFSDVLHKIADDTPDVLPMTRDIEAFLRELRI